jgi:hypothetical protein
MPLFICTVNEAGPAADGTETPPPVVYIKLSDQADPPAFSGQWFYAAVNSKEEMLAVALTAISTGSSVSADAVQPNAGGQPYTEISRLFVQT